MKRWWVREGGGTECWGGSSASRLGRRFLSLVGTVDMREEWMLGIHSVVKGDSRTLTSLPIKHRPGLLSYPCSA